MLFNRLKLGTRALLAVIFAAGAGIVSFELAGGRDTSPAVASSSDDLSVSAVAALGRIEPVSGLMNVSAATPDVLETLLVQRGDLVERDQVLGYLQSHAEQVAQRDSIAAQLDEAKARLAAEEELCQAQIENAEIKVRRVEDLAPLKIAAQEQTVRSLRSRPRKSQFRSRPAGTTGEADATGEAGEIRSRGSYRGNGGSTHGTWTVRNKGSLSPRLSPSTNSSSVPG